MKKSKTRIYIKKVISSNLLIYIKDKQHHFLKNVMRVKINDIIRIFDGKTGEWLSQVLSINKENISDIIVDAFLSVPTYDANLSIKPISQ